MKKPKYLFPCPCGITLPVDPVQAGQSVHCRCGREHILPTMLEISRLARCDAEPLTAGAVWGIQQRVIFLGVLAISIGALLCGTIYFTRPKPPAPAPTIEQIRQHTDSLTLSESVLLWGELLKGLDARPRAQDSAYEADSASARRWMAVAVAISAVGLALASLGFFLPATVPTEPDAE